jgi:hypothetical protein
VYAVLRISYAYKGAAVTTTVSAAIVSPNSAPGSKRRRWPALLLILVAVAFVAFALPPYLTVDPSRSRIPPPSIAGYYAALVAHVLFGAIAMLTGALQMWPWLRRRYPVIHRRVGRVYVFGGVLPAGMAGFALGSVSPFGPVLRVSDVLLAILWLTATVIAFRLARRRRFAEHRRWMIRSVVLTMSVITNRVWAVIWFLVLSPHVSTSFAGSEAWMVQTIAGLSGWMGWVIPLVVTEWLSDWK